jgi:hypothetical protein
MPVPLFSHQQLCSIYISLFMLYEKPPVSLLLDDTTILVWHDHKSVYTNCVCSIEMKFSLSTSGCVPSHVEKKAQCRAVPVAQCQVYEQCVMIVRCVNFCSLLGRHLAFIVGFTALLFTMKGKAVQFQASTYPLGLQEVLPPSRHAWYSFLLEADSTPGQSAGGRTVEVNDKLHWCHRESNKRTSGCSAVPPTN